MNWCDGSISLAISNAKKNKSLFFVYIFVDGLEDNFEELFSDESVFSRLNSKSVSLKLKDKSVAFGQFSQIYPVTSVPSVHLINSTTGVRCSELILRSETSLEILVQSIDQALGSFMDFTNCVSAINSDVVPSPRAERVDAACKILADEIQTANNVQTPVESSSAISLQDRVARAKELLSQRKVAKNIEEVEKEKTDEIKRRDVGKSILENERSKEQTKIEESLEEHKRERREVNIARDRVREQIAQDRLDRAEKFRLQKEAYEETRLKNVKDIKPETSSTSTSASSVCRLQFRMPDGRCLNRNFVVENSFSLNEIYEYVASENNGNRNFRLFTAFPRRALEELNMDELLPCTSIVVMSTSALQATSWSYSYLLQLLFTPLTAIFQFIRGFFMTSLSTTDPHQINGETVPNERQRSSYSAARGRGANSTSLSSDSSPNLRFRSDGNMRRFNENFDGDEDSNNTWNGNSTQQQ